MDDPPRRWADDSPEEDAEVAPRRRARQARTVDAPSSGPGRWPTRSAEHGILPGDGEGWAGPLILPDWWDEIPEPGDCCPWCQRHVPAPCPECREARAADATRPPRGPGGLAAPRRSAGSTSPRRYGTDPWSGRRCTIRREWTDVDAEGQIRTTHPLYRGAAPAGIYWGAQRRGLA